MTLRLVALISVLLLLSLAAFGLLVNHYQARFMDEVAQTASAAGRAALRTLEWREAAGVERLSAALPRTAPEAIELRQHTVAVVVDVDEVSAEADRAGGLVLRIPTFSPSGTETTIEHMKRPDGTLVTRREEVTLPLPLGHYERLFALLRNRSLAVFCGVLLVGVALSAGLATRFTRPIRRLDMGLRRLSEGDLDVQVEVRGRDEIARLSRAFNDMARTLRANRERSDELVRREKLSALGRLAAGVAHDVRNPLHSIGLTLQHLREAARPEAPERVAEFERSLEIIRGEIRRLDGLVTNFLRFARSERGERQRLDLAELVREVARLVHKEAEWRRVALVLRVEPDTPAIEADAEALRSAVLNLVLNGFEAMPQGGTLTLRLRCLAGEVLLEVIDTGRGIAEADQERVFEFAYTTREGGSGLGLAMVHHCIVEEHGGRVGLESRPGAGTRVLLALPAPLARGPVSA